MSNGDILGHEFCGVVDEVGDQVTNIKKGGRYVASFQIACGDVSRSLREFCWLRDTDSPVVLFLQEQALLSMREDQLQHN